MPGRGYLGHAFALVLGLVLAATASAGEAEWLANMRAGQAAYQSGNYLEAVVRLPAALNAGNRQGIMGKHLTYRWTTGRQTASG